MNMPAIPHARRPEAGYTDYTAHRALDVLEQHLIHERRQHRETRVALGLCVALSILLAGALAYAVTR